MASVVFDSRQNLKRGFFASLAIHGAFVLLLVIVACIPHRFHFDQATLIELQGISSSVKGTGLSNSSATASKQAKSEPRAPKTATLKTKSRTNQEAVKTAIKTEKVSLNKLKKSAEPEPSLKDRILQKLQQATAAGRRTDAVANSPNPGVSAAGAIGTDVPFPFASYLAQVQDRITDAWEQPSWLSVQNGEVKALVVFRISRNGTVAKVVLAVPSGVTVFDQSAVQAVEAANPLPPLPLEFKNEFLDVHLQFDLTH